MTRQSLRHALRLRWQSVMQFACSQAHPPGAMIMRPPLLVSSGRSGMALAKPQTLFWRSPRQRLPRRLLLYHQRRAIGHRTVSYHTVGRTIAQRRHPPRASHHRHPGYPVLPLLLPIYTWRPSLPQSSRAPLAHPTKGRHSALWSAPGISGGVDELFRCAWTGQRHPDSPAAQQRRWRHQLIGIAIAGSYHATNWHRSRTNRPS